MMMRNSGEKVNTKESPRTSISNNVNKPITKDDPL